MQRPKEVRDKEGQRMRKKKRPRETGVKQGESRSERSV